MEEFFLTWKCHFFILRKLNQYKGNDSNLAIVLKKEKHS